MKLFTKIWLFSGLAGLLVLGAFIALSPKVLAASPICIFNAPTQPNQKIDCSEAAGAIKAAGLGSAKADTCYYEDEGTSGIASLPTVTAAPIGSAQCNTWLAQVKSVGAVAPTCQRVSGKLQDYVNGILDASKFQAIKCDAGLLKLIKSSGITSFAPGVCYQVFSDNTATADSCTNIKKEQATAKTNAAAAAAASSSAFQQKGPALSGDTCGGPGNAVKISLKIGCQGKGNAILDMLFAIIRFLSLGVGIVVVGSVVVGGIQYTSSRGDPKAVADAQERIRSSVIALLIYIFTYAILNWIIPAGLLK